MQNLKLQLPFLYSQEGNERLRGSKKQSTHLEEAEKWVSNIFGTASTWPAWQGAVSPTALAARKSHTGPSCLALVSLTIQRFPLLNPLKSSLPAVAEASGAATTFLNCTQNETMPKPSFHWQAQESPWMRGRGGEGQPTWDSHRAAWHGMCWQLQHPMKACEGEKSTTRRLHFCDLSIGIQRYSAALPLLTSGNNSDVLTCRCRRTSREAGRALT
jgi:hypothetical protein